jgi:hypothetical protein
MVGISLLLSSVLSSSATAPKLSVKALASSSFQKEMANNSKLYRWLSWQISFNDGYVSNPPGGVKKNDMVLSLGDRGRASLQRVQSRTDTPVPSE